MEAIASPTKISPTSDIVAVTPPNASLANGNGNQSTPEVTPSPKMSRREEVALKSANKKKEEEDNCSFKPTIAPHRKPLKKNGDPESPTKPPEEAYSRLYTDARKKQEEAKIPPKPECSFKPTLVHRNTSGSKEKVRAQSPIESFNRLYRTSHRQSRPVEQASFKPTISKRAKSLERNPGVSTSDRLYAQAVLAKEKQEKVRETIRKQEEAALTFVPSTNESTKPKSAAEKGVKSAPVSERMKGYIEARNRKLEEAKREKEAKEAAEYTGRPSIGKHRKDSKTTVTAAGANVFDRLTKVEVAAVREKDAEETFKPTIYTSKRSQSASRATRKSAGMPGNEQGGGKIYDRLFNEAEQRRRELAAERDLARQEEEKQLTFTPQISGRPSDGSHEMSQRDASGATMSVFKRLNSMAKDEAIKKNEKTKAEIEMENCTFHPTINQRSSGLFHASDPVHVRLMKEAERQKEMKIHLEERKAEEELMNCTFAPDLTKSSMTMSFNNGNAGRQSGDFSRGESFTFSEVDETEKRSPKGVVARPVVKTPPAISPPARTPVISPPLAAVPAPVVSPVATHISPAGLKPIPGGVPAGLTALKLSSAPTGLKSLPMNTISTPEVAVAPNGN